MSSWLVTCDSCDESWPRLGAFSEYESESIESRPCPHCGAYTLRCVAVEPARRGAGRGGREARAVYAASHAA